MLSGFGSVARINDTSEPAVGVDQQMFTRAILPQFGASRTTGNGFVTASANVFEFGNVEAYGLKATREKPRADLPSRFTECDFET